MIVHSDRVKNCFGIRQKFIEHVQGLYFILLKKKLVKLEIQFTIFSFKLHPENWFRYLFGCYSKKSLVNLLLKIDTDIILLIEGYEQLVCTR